MRIAVFVLPRDFSVYVISILIIARISAVKISPRKNVGVTGGKPPRASSGYGPAKDFFEPRFNSRLCSKARGQV
jgi:hypothetical protein